MSQNSIILPPVPPLNLETAGVKSLNARIEAFEKLCNSAFSGNANWRDKDSHKQRLEALMVEKSKLIQKLKDDYDKLLLAREKEQKELDEDIEKSEKKWNSSITAISDLIESNSNSEETSSEINPINDLEL